MAASSVAHSGHLSLSHRVVSGQPRSPVGVGGRFPGGSQCLAVPTDVPAADGTRVFVPRSSAATRSNVTSGPRAGVMGAWQDPARPQLGPESEGVAGRLGQGLYSPAHFSHPTLSIKLAPPNPFIWAPVTRSPFQGRLSLHRFHCFSEILLPRTLEQASLGPVPSPQITNSDPKTIVSSGPTQALFPLQQSWF